MPIAKERSIRIQSRANNTVTRIPTRRPSNRVFHASSLAHPCSFLPRHPPLPHTTFPSPQNRRTATRNFPGFTPVAETAVERNFRSRKKPRANTAIKRAPGKNPRFYPSLLLSLTLSFSSIPLTTRAPHQPPQEADLHARPAGCEIVERKTDLERERDRGRRSRSKRRENRCDPFAMGKRDRERLRGGGGGGGGHVTARERSDDGRRGGRGKLRAAWTEK